MWRRESVEEPSTHHSVAVTGLEGDESSRSVACTLVAWLGLATAEVVEIGRKRRGDWRVVVAVAVLIIDLALAGWLIQLVASGDPLPSLGSNAITPVLDLLG